MLFIATIASAFAVAFYVYAAIFAPGAARLTRMPTRDVAWVGAVLVVVGSVLLLLHFSTRLLMAEIWTMVPESPVRFGGKVFVTALGVLLLIHSAVAVVRSSNRGRA